MSVKGSLGYQVYNSRAWRRVRLEILERDGWMCQVRGSLCTLDADRVDHIVPIEAGGEWYEPSNLRAACRACNAQRVWSPSRRRPSREW